MKKKIIMVGMVVLAGVALAGPPDGWPIKGAGIENISSGFGYRHDGYGGKEGFHHAIDIAFPIGTPVYATHSGYVTDHWPAPDGYWTGHEIFGGCMTITAPDGWATFYGHLSGTRVREQDPISKGDLIGFVGETGLSTGPHLHYEILVDPMRFITGTGTETSFRSIGTALPLEPGPYGQ